MLEARAHRTPDTSSALRQGGEGWKQNKYTVPIDSAEPFLLPIAYVLSLGQQNNHWTLTARFPSS